MSHDIGYENGGRVAVTTFDYKQFDVEIIDQAKREMARDMHIECWMIVQRVVDIIIADKKVELAKDCLWFAMGNTPLSEVEIARKYGITKQAVSKRIVNFTGILKLMPSPGMRSLEARETFRKVQTCNHARKKAINGKTSPEMPELSNLSQITLNGSTKNGRH